MSARRSRPSLGARCYACEAPATTWEHAPAQAYYPKLSELGANDLPRNYRTNLIRVPSCPAHNNAKSKDDNYAAAVIITLSGLLKTAGTTIPIPPFFRMWMKRMNTGIRLRHTLDSAEPVRLLDARGRQLGGTLTLESSAIDGIIQGTVRALYYHHHGWKRRWPEDCFVRNLHLVMSDLRLPPNADAFRQMEGAFVELDRRGGEIGKRHGPHPEIFFYQLLEPEDGTKAMRLVFYQYFTFIAIARTLAPRGSEEVEPQMDGERMTRPREKPADAHAAVAERAYFLWQNRPGSRWWDPVSNWLEAELAPRRRAVIGEPPNRR